MVSNSTQNNLDSIRKIHRGYVFTLIPLHFLIGAIISLKFIYAGDGTEFAKFGAVIIASSLAIIGAFRWKTDEVIGIINDNIRIFQAAIQMESNAKVANAFSQLTKMTTGIEIPTVVKTDLNGQANLDEALEARRLFAKTSTTLWVTELAFVAVGTIITAYGTDIVNFIHGQ